MLISKNMKGVFIIILFCFAGSLYPQMNEVIINSEDFETGAFGWTYVDGNGDSVYWNVGTTPDINPDYPPSYGTAFAYYSDEDAGNGVINTNEEWLSPAFCIKDIDSLVLEYGWGIQIRQVGEEMRVEARFFSSGFWGLWDTKFVHNTSGSGTTMINLTDALPADSIQIRWIYNDTTSQNHYGFACAVDNVILRGYAKINHYNVFLWDNDGGTLIFDDEIQQALGFELYLKNALLNNLLPLSCSLTVAEVLPPIEELLNYDALFIVNGVGMLMDTFDLMKIEQYMGAGGNVYLEGTNIGEFLKNTYPSLLDSFKADFVGNTFNLISNIYGTDSSFTAGENFLYFSDTGLLQSFDILAPIGNGINILQTGDTLKAYVCRGVGYSYSAEKSGKSSTGRTSIISSVNITALKKVDPFGNSQDIRDEYVRKILAYMGLGKILIVDYATSELNNFLEDLYSIGYKNFEVITTSPYLSDMKLYSGIIWRTGKDTIGLSSDDTINLKEYIEYGGRVLLTGENLAQKLGIPGYGQETNFLIDYFGVDYITDSVYSNYIQGVRSYNGYSTGYTGRIPDHLSGFDTCFIYNALKSGEGAGFLNTYSKTKTLFLGFSYDEMSDPYTRQAILSKTFTMWGINKSKEQPTGIIKREKLKDDRNYLLITDFRELKNYFPLYDISGRKIGNPIKNGIYIFKGKNGIKKLIYIGK